MWLRFPKDSHTKHTATSNPVFQTRREGVPPIMTTILIIVLIVLLLGGGFGYSRRGR